MLLQIKNDEEREMQAKVTEAQLQQKKQQRRRDLERQRLQEQPLSVAVKCGIEEGIKSIANMLKTILDASKLAPISHLLDRIQILRM